MGSGSLDDIRALAAAGAEAVVVGRRRLYEGRFTLGEAICRHLTSRLVVGLLERTSISLTTVTSSNPPTRLPRTAHPASGVQSE